MKYMILLYDSADMREIFSSRSDLMEEMDGLPGFVTLQITRSALLLRPAADPEQELDLGLFVPVT